MGCASPAQRRNVIGRQRTDRQGIVIVTKDNWRQDPPIHSLEEIFANPDFLARATATARRDARSTRLAVILQTARLLAADLSVVQRPLDVLNVPFGPSPSPADTFTTISTLLSVPWAHGDCSQKVMELQRSGEALRPGLDPLAAFYEAVALDLRTRDRNRSSSTVSVQEKKLEMALEEYTKALTAWMREVLGS